MKPKSKTGIMVLHVKGLEYGYSDLRSRKSNN